MGKYALKRLLIAIPTFLGITILVYIISCLAPGSPLEMILADPMATEADRIALEHQMGLDDPVIVQYLRWLGNLVKGNLGYSYRTKLPVADMIGQCIWPTLLLTLASVVLALMGNIL